MARPSVLAVLYNFRVVVVQTWYLYMMSSRLFCFKRVAQLL